MTDKEIKQRLREIETRKVHQCAMALKAKGLFTREELRQTLREYGVARAYFEQLYHLDWCYEWIKEDEMTFEEFIESLSLNLKASSFFTMKELIQKSMKTDTDLTATKLNTMNSSTDIVWLFRKRNF